MSNATATKSKFYEREDALNIRTRGEDVKAGQPLVQTGARLDAGKLALLATAGCAQPLVSPRLRVVHFTTGDEIIPPDQTPKPGQIRDSNSILIRGLLQKFPCDVTQKHLPENFEQAKSEISNLKSQIENADLLLVSGGASVGDKDFTRPLLEWLGFEIVFSQVNVRPGRPLIFGDERASQPCCVRVPGNPLSHFVCFHLFVATALAKLAGETRQSFCAASSRRSWTTRRIRAKLSGRRGWNLNGEWLASADVGEFRRRDLSGGSQRVDSRAGKSRFD